VASFDARSSALRFCLEVTVGVGTPLKVLACALSAATLALKIFCLDRFLGYPMLAVPSRLHLA
jgi:hypothetical protein